MRDPILLSTNPETIKLAFQTGKSFSSSLRIEQNDPAYREKLKPEVAVLAKKLGSLPLLVVALDGASNRFRSAKAGWNESVGRAELRKCYHRAVLKLKPSEIDYEELYNGDLDHSTSSENRPLEHSADYLVRWHVKAAVRLGKTPPEVLAEAINGMATVVRMVGPAYKRFAINGLGSARCDLHNDPVACYLGKVYWLGALKMGEINNFSACYVSCCMEVARHLGLNKASILEAGIKAAKRALKINPRHLDAIKHSAGLPYLIKSKAVEMVMGVGAQL